MTLLPYLRLSAFGIAAALAACGAPELRYAAPETAPEVRVSSRYASIEVVEVSLPTYAADEQIYIQDADGALAPLGPLWADDPARSITLQLARDLGQITGAQVAAEPWPFRDYAQVKVDVRLEDMRATESGSFVLAGQYYVAPDSGGRNRAGSFRFEAPVAEPGTAAQIAAARSVVVTQLAETVARQGL
ncbi:PqiC family protein [Mesobacterium pallidum]|uniref:PqiC family protein n=1 Tax=Mesobacterium pallidum TaxID=2872037 RepID=UPI001EE174B9|nr:PqiC family protein [Mesobacterium pallidum]